MHYCKLSPGQEGEQAKVGGVRSNSFFLSIRSKNTTFSAGLYLVEYELQENIYITPQNYKQIYTY